MSELDLNWHPEHCPWLRKNSIWKTEAAFWNWLRGGLRRSIWKNSPIKIQFIIDNRIRVPGKKKDTTCWGGKCGLCGTISTLNKMQVDHVKGNVSLKSWDDVLKFVQHLSSPGELQFACDKCHKAKTLSERKGISFEEGIIEKEVIEVCKLSKEEVLAFLKKNKYNGPTNNAKVRREGVKHVITKQRAQSV